MECKDDPNNLDEYQQDRDHLPRMRHIEEDTEIAEKYLIKSIPTMLLLDDNDNVIHKWIGYTKSADINKFIAEL